MSRLRSFLFAVFRRDGERFFATFYASNAKQATQYARQWARGTGHVRVELQVDEEAV